MRKLYTKDISQVVVKVGTSILTRNGRFDRRIVAELCAQIAKLLDRGIQVYVVSSGAIGAGMTILQERKRPKTMEGLQAAAAIGQRYLMQCYEEALSKKGYSTAQVLLTWDDLAHRKRFMNAKRTLQEIQKKGLVPIINENDTVATDEIRFGDNDRLSSLLAILVGADVHVILSDTNGLYASEKKRDRIQVVHRMHDGVFDLAKDHKTRFTVGGMRSKLRAIHMSVSSGIPVFLACGRQKQVLLHLFEGLDIGTFFVPHVARKDGRKNWLRYFINHIRKGSRR